MSDRTYGDGCGVARALDVVGERWALLVVRELLLGPKRFGDLQRGLAGASQNVLAQRLRELEAAGVVVRRRLGPPARASVYELTEEGAALEPVLLALGAWGRHRPMPGAPGLSVDAFALALRTTFDPGAAGDLRAEIELRADDDVLALTIADGGIAIARGSAVMPDATIEADVPTLRALAFGARRSDDGTVPVEGDAAVAQRAFDSFAKRATPETVEEVGTPGAGRSSTAS